MGYTAIAGDHATTTALAVASTWPGDEEVVIVEADPSGGSIAAWLDLSPGPSLSTAVATFAAQSDDHASRDTMQWPTLTSMLQQLGVGARVLVAPMSGREARRTVDEAARVVLPYLARRSGADVLVECGLVRAGDPLPPAVRLADRVVLCHRQESASAGAASVRLQRLVELAEALATTGTLLVLAVIGSDPYDIGEIGEFVDERFAAAGAPVRPAVVPLADDPLAAAVLAGRSGVSARRLARLPLMRSAGELADLLRWRPSQTTDGVSEATR